MGMVAAAGTRDERRRLGLALAASLAVHAAVVAWVAFAAKPPRIPPKQPPRVMDVVLLRTPGKETPPPENARAIAQRNARGGSRAQDRITRAARAPVVGRAAAPRPRPPAAPPAPPRKPQVPQAVRPLARRSREGVRTRRRASPEPAPPTPAPERPALHDLLPSTMALAELSRDFERERRMKQMLEREADVPINTRKAKFAPYAHALVRVLEEQWRPGGADYARYSDAERRALIRLTINRDGTVAAVELLRPSPIARINESAVQAIYAAAPFRPLPASWGLDRVSFYLTFEVVEDRFVFRTM